MHVEGKCEDAVESCKYLGTLFMEMFVPPEVGFSTSRNVKWLRQGVVGLTRTLKGAPADWPWHINVPSCHVQPLAGLQGDMSCSCSFASTVLL